MSDHRAGGGADGGTTPVGPGGAPAAPPSAPAWRLVTTLAVAGALAGLLIVGVYEWAQPRILEHRARVLSVAIEEVLGAPDRYRTLFVHEGALVPEPPAGADTVRAEKVYQGFDAAGGTIGFAVVGAKSGFQDVVQLIFGYDAREDRVIGMRILESKETPGLGDRIFKDASFVAEFSGVAAPIAGVKEGAGAGEPNEVDMITGATISSRTVIEIINGRVESLDPLLDAFEGGGTP